MTDTRLPDTPTPGRGEPRVGSGGRQRTRQRVSRRDRRETDDERRVARAAAQVAAARPGERRYRQMVKRVDLWTVLKISVCFYLCALVVALVTGAVLWWIASAFGVIGSVEDFMGELLEADDTFRFLSWRILRGATLVGLVLVCIMVVLTTLAAALYNLFAEVIGGIEWVVTEEEEPARRA